jgi:hypothetical protein
MEEAVITLCVEHRTEWLAWLDYRLPPASIPVTASAAYDVSTAGTRDRRESRHRQWVDTITTQQALIVAACARECG